MVEPYNATLSIHQLVENADCVYALDNEVGAYVLMVVDWADCTCDGVCAVVCVLLRSMADDGRGGPSIVSCSDAPTPL